jgi:predicted TIM-barrel fold metal-dependent hydrolase
VPLFAQNGWARRLLGAKSNWAGDGKSWSEALEAGGMAMAVLYFSCGAHEPLLPQALAYVGHDRIMYASDFRHWDHSYPKSVKELADRADLADDAKRQVLAANARRFYKL